MNAMHADIYIHDIYYISHSQILAFGRMCWTPVQQIQVYNNARLGGEGTDGIGYGYALFLPLPCMILHACCWA